MPEEDQKDEKLFQLKMVKLESLKKSNHFKMILKEKKLHTDFFSIFAAKNFINQKNNNLLISFVMKKKIGNAVIRNRIKRKLRNAVQKILKETRIINLNYTYVIFGKNNVYKDTFKNILEEVNEAFKKIKNTGN